ncbi:hypothetical protein ACTHPJ_24005 [Paenibacillus amylolyticus]|uniref:hypothetical protein n=1 Tax=Paenibacillus amylolyticus TaxID=1451 RepID=UPI003F7D9B2F
MNYANEVEFVPFNKIQSQNKLLPYIQEYYEGENLGELYIALIKDKFGDEVVVSVQLHKFIMDIDTSVNLKLFFDEITPSTAALAYKWSEEMMILHDINSLKRRRWHGSILLRQALVLCRLMNEYTLKRNQKFIEEHKDNLEILNYVNNNSTNYVRPLIQTLEGEVVPDTTIPIDGLRSFYTYNNGLKDDRVRFEIY